MKATSNQTQITLTKVLVFTAIVAFVFANAALVFAYSVSPLVIDRAMKVRDAEDVTITIVNTSSAPLEIYPTVNAISLDNEGTISEFITPTLADSRTTITRWLEISRAKIAIAPGASHQVTLTIKMPPDVVPGQYHAFIGFPSAGNRPLAEEMVAKGGVPGSVVSIGVDKQTVTILRLGKFFVDRFVTDTEGKSAHITLTNNGTETLSPKGEVIFYDTSGNEVAAAAFNNEGDWLEPGIEKSFLVPLPQQLGSGKHKAYLDIEYGPQSAQLQDTTFFYIVPLKSLVALFFGLLALTLFLAWRVHRRYVHPENDYEAVGSVPFTVRSVQSEAKDHDIDLKKPQV